MTCYIEPSHQNSEFHTLLFKNITIRASLNIILDNFISCCIFSVRKLLESKHLGTTELCGCPYFILVFYFNRLKNDFPKLFTGYYSESMNLLLYKSWTSSRFDKLVALWWGLYVRLLCVVLIVTKYLTGGQEIKGESRWSRWLKLRITLCYSTMRIANRFKDCPYPENHQSISPTATLALELEALFQASDFAVFKVLKCTVLVTGTSRD